MSAHEKDELMRTVQAQVALANMQELLSVSRPLFVIACVSHQLICC